MSSQLLSIPTKLPRFCTDNPTAITEPSEGDKDDGFTLNAFVNSQWFNWFQNLNYQWLKVTLSILLGNWFTKSLTTTGTPDSCVFFPVNGQKKWYFYFTHTPSFTRRFYNPFSSSSIVRLGASEGALSNILVYDSQRLILADYVVSTQNLVVSTDGESWTAVDIGVSGAVSALGIKRPHDDDNFIVVGFSTGKIHYASVVTGTFYAASVERPISGSTEHISSFCYLGNSNWMALYLVGETWVSTDDCDNWAITTNTPSSVGLITAGCNSIDSNLETGTVIAVGDSGAIARSPNSGTDWASVNININGIDVNNLTKVVHVGGGAWVAVGEPLTPTSGVFIAYPGIIASVDDGKTWGMPNYDIMTLGPTSFDDTSDIVDVCCDGTRIIAIDNEGSVYITNSILLSEE